MQHRESLQLSSILVVLEVKTLPDPPRRPRGAQEGRRWVPGGSQDPPRAPLEPPKVAQGSPKGRPRSPRSSQKHPQEGKIEAETRPRSILKPMSFQNHIRSRFSIDFPSKSSPKSACKSIAIFEEQFRRSCHRSTKRCCENHGFTLVKPHIS